MKSPAFTLLVFNLMWAAPSFAKALKDKRLHHPASFPTHAKRNRHEDIRLSSVEAQRHRWTLDEIEFAASSRYEIGTPRNNRKAFTLTELLVVLVVILSITAMMLPAIHNARNSAKAAACSANLARLLTAMAAYESMDESFPYGFERRTDPPPGGSPGSSYDTAGWWWFNYIDVYSGGSPYKPSIVKCPAKRLTDRKLQLDILCGNYGANLSICREAGRINTEFKGMPLSRSEVQSPSQTMLLADSGYAIIKWHHATQSPPAALNRNKITDTGAYIPGLSINSQRLSQGLIFTGMEKDAIDGRHPGKTVNVGFVDGHVERTQAEDLLADLRG